MKKGNQMCFKRFALSIILLLAVNTTVLAAETNHEIIDAKDITSLLSANDAKVKVAFIFTSWCRYCKVGFQQIKVIASQYSTSDLKIIPISLDDKQSQFESFVDSYNKDLVIPKVYRVNFSNSRELVKELANAKIQYQGAIPHVTVYNKEGKVLIDGTFNGEYLSALVESLIKK